MKAIKFLSIYHVFFMYVSNYHGPRFFRISICMWHFIVYYTPSYEVVVVAWDGDVVEISLWATWADMLANRHPASLPQYIGNANGF